MKNVLRPGPASVLLCLMLLLTSCEDDDGVQRPAPGESKTSSVILCEGNQGADNSTLSRWSREDLQLENAIFSRSNPGLRLGDTANDLLLIGDTIFVAVDGSRTIEFLHASSSAWLGRIIMPEGYGPRFLAGKTSSELWVSVATKNCVIPIDVKAQTPVRVEDCIPVGSAPEKMALHANWLAVANSGFGTVFKDHPKAGTVSIVDLSQKTEVRLLRPGPNTVDVSFNNDGSRMYAHYLHLPGSDWPRNDSLAGIVEYETANWTPLRHWRLASMIYDLVYDETTDCLYTITLDGLVEIDLNDSNAQPQLFFAKNGPENEIWYSLAFDAGNSEFWIGNARDFVVAGEVLRLGRQGNLLDRFQVGRNPGAFVFAGR